MIEFFLESNLAKLKEEDILKFLKFTESLGDSRLS